MKLLKPIFRAVLRRPINLRDALLESEAIWEYLAKTKKNKPWFLSTLYHSSCPLCDYVVTNKPEKACSAYCASVCPVTWTEDHRLCGGGSESPFWRRYFADRGTSEKRQTALEILALIRDAIDRHQAR